ncbi:MAG: ROK family transcriptional regulator [Spirochaetales bacterium]|nr:ROK family transcriptional regulator [Spirochaetales bacterium]MCF7938424.1 ROK family transcriptional regulator [Spirochaetales bacterium]
MNISIVFNFLRDVGVSYRAEIARQLKLSLPAVSRAVEKLIEQGYVVEGEKISTETGKKAVSVKINLQKGAVLGVDMLTERVRFALFDLNGNLIDSYSGGSLSESKNITADLIRDIKTFLAERKKNGGGKNSKIQSIAIGVPAVVDVNTQTITNAYLYNGLEHADLKEELAKKFDTSVYVENIVKMAALGEYNYGQGEGYENIIFIEIGNGIGAGIIIDGEILRGASGAAGEIGFTLVGEENLTYKGNNQGYLEKFASIAGIRETAIQGIRQGRKTQIRNMVGDNIEEVKAAIVFEAAMNGDDFSLEIIQSTLKKLTIAVINLIIIINPQLIVFGGDIAACSGVESQFLKPMQESLEQILPFNPPKLVLSSLGQDSALYGASLVAVESLFTGMYPYRIA